MIHINQSKGNTDRIFSFPDKLLDILREYYLIYKPSDYLFEGERGNRYSKRSVQLILKKNHYQWLRSKPKVQSIRYDIRMLHI